jgi:hypothetical protein
MTEQQVQMIFTECAAYWPHQPMPRIAVAGWMNLLAGADPELVLEAVKAHAAAGEKFPPTAGEVLRALTMAHAAAPEWDQALSEIRDMLRALNRDHRFNSQPVFNFHEPEAMEWSSPELADFVRRLGGVNTFRQEIAWYPGLTDNTTFIAQARDQWKAVKHRTDRRNELEAAGARRLLELEQTNTPQPIGELVAAALPGEAQR